MSQCFSTKKGIYTRNSLQQASGEFNSRNIKNIEREKFNIIQRLGVARTAYFSIKHFAKQLVNVL